MNAGFVGAKPTDLSMTATERFAYELLVILKVCLNYYFLAIMYPRKDV